MAREDGCLFIYTGFIDHSGDALGARIISLLLRDGLTFTHALHGQYAGILIDLASCRVILFQDSFGLRTLYYTIKSGKIIVSSEIRRLRCFTENCIDDQYFAYLLCDGQPSPVRTPFAAITKLSLGINLELKGSSQRMSEPWIPAPWAPYSGDPEEALCEHLDAAVAAAAPSRAEVSICELSGGIDSSSVAATLSQSLKAPTALTYVSGRGLIGEDEAYAAALVERYGLLWHQLDLDLFPRYSLRPDRFLGEPGDEPHQAVQHAYRSIIERLKTDVILTGVGGDIVMGYGGIPPIHLADALVYGRFVEAISTARAWAKQADRHRPWTHYMARFGLPAAYRYVAKRSSVSKRIETFPSWISRELSKLYLQSQPVQFVPRGGVPSRQYLWDSVFQMSALEASNGFRNSLAASTRHPLLHRPLVEFMLGLDWKMRSIGRENTNLDRVLQRRALVDRLPSQILSRTTKGSDQPLHETVLLRSDDFFHSLLSESRLVRFGWVDQARWAEQIARARFGLFGSLRHFDATIACEMWLRTLEAPDEIFKPLQIVPIDDFRRC